MMHQQLPVWEFAACMGRLMGVLVFIPLVRGRRIVALVGTALSVWLAVLYLVGDFRSGPGAVFVMGDVGESFFSLRFILFEIILGLVLGMVLWAALEVFLSLGAASLFFLDRWARGSRPGRLIPHSVNTGESAGLPWSTLCGLLVLLLVFDAGWHRGILRLLMGSLVRVPPGQWVMEEEVLLSAGGPIMAEAMVLGGVLLVTSLGLLLIPTLLGGLVGSITTMTRGYGHHADWGLAPRLSVMCALLVVVLVFFLPGATSFLLGGLAHLMEGLLP